MGAQGSPEGGVRLHGLKLASVGFHAGSGDDFSQGAPTAAKLSSCIEDAGCWGTSTYKSVGTLKGYWEQNAGELHQGGSFWKVSV